MDTKWKSNDHKSVRTACAAVLLLTVVFTAFLPFFRGRADNEFTDPFTTTFFIQMLFENNYVQYKYLRERADQRTYSFGNLYVEAEYITTEQEAYDNLKTTIYEVPEDAVAHSSALADEVKTVQESTVSILWETRSRSQELMQRMDYYAVDKKSGVSIGNSSQPALQEIAEGNTPEDNPYVYYVFLNYDSIGNLENCGVSSTGDAGEFLKLVEAQGRDHFLTESFNEEGICYADFYNSYEDEYYRYLFTAKRPSDMKIVYAMTEEQYQSFMGGYESEYFGFLPNYVSASKLSYYRAGVTGMILIFAAVAMVLGAGMVYFGNRKKAGAYTYQELRICNLPLEINAFLIAVGLMLPEPLSDQICAYHKGWFLPNFTKQILEPWQMGWVRLPILAALFFAYFLAAYTAGSILPQMLHFRSYFKEHSIIYRYWDRILTFMKEFYHELVSFDIGTDARRIISKLVIVNFLILAGMSLFWVWGIFFMAVYSLIIYFLLKKYVKDIQNKYRNLLKATSSIARGDLDIVLSEDFGVFESYKNELRQIQTDFKRAVEEEVKSQRMKSELITNVSHDLKTPLTAIITYINLLKVPGITEEQRTEYINTLDKKAVRLKVLIEDLFEVSKATTNNVTLNYDRVDICNLLRQCYLEYEDRIEAADLQFKFMLPDEKVVLTLDPQKTFRIFENLYTNTVKYALPATRVYVTVRDRADDVEIEIKNISRTELSVSPEELTERFVRGDGSRNTEGSGLGLAIARSFTELQHGTLQIAVDGDLFKVLLIFRKWNGPKDAEETGKKPEAGSAEAASGKESAGARQAAAAQGRLQPSGQPNPGYDPRRWRTEKNLRKKRWK